MADLRKLLRKEQKLLQEREFLDFELNVADNDDISVVIAFNHLTKKLDRVRAKIIKALRDELEIREHRK